MNTYVKRFLESKASSQLLALFNKGKSPCKEISESYGILEAAKKYCEDLSSYEVYVIGDGSTPRTAALFSFMSKANCFSIDPAMNMDYFEKWSSKELPQRLTVFKSAFQNIEKRCVGGRNLLVVWPHSHAPMKESLNFFVDYAKRIDIVMPCCVTIPACFLSRPHICYQDTAVMSPKNLIHIFND